MKVKLISYTQPSSGMLECGIEDIQTLVTFCARVSNPTNQYNTLTAEKLIKYLLKHKHFSPFEMVDITLELEPTRDIGRQILRHRSFSFNEFSQRYASVEDLGNMFEISECRLQDTKNRQNSLDTDDEELSEWWNNEQEYLISVVSELYQSALDKGIAKEVARKVLPEGLTKTRMYMKGSVRSWIHYLEVRLDEASQKEHRDIALEISKVISEVFPINFYTEV